MTDHAAQPADYSGQAVGGGRYQLQSLLGTGGMASVHLAYDTVLDRQIAVKTMHGELGREESFRERFKREAQSVAKLTHTNIVSVFDTGEDEIDGHPVPFIVMEYVDGQPLRNALDEAVAQHGAMPADQALSVTADVLAALDISHEMGLVHRDIKPGNVMLTSRGVVKVMDFGIARAMQSGVTSMTQTGMVVGTPQYLSPEQALGRGVDARSDLYSVGVMLFELLTGRLPFDADSPLAIAYAHVQEEPPVPSSINATIPPALDALVAQMLRKNPADRFPDAQAARTACQQVAGALTGAAPQITSTGPVSSGAAVANSVFPEFGSPTPPPGAASPYAPSAPGAYGYPHPPTAPQLGMSTPPPYGATPPTGTAAAKQGNRTPLMILGGLLAAALVVGGVIIVTSGDDGGGTVADGQTTDGPDDTDDGTDDGTDEPDEEPDEDPKNDEPRFNPGDPEKKVEASLCTHPREYWNDEEYPDAYSMPDFYNHHVASVKECMRSGRATHEDDKAWAYTEDETVDETVVGQNMVVDQHPKAGEPYDPVEDEITLTVSTGKEPRR